ncbi:phosphatidylinositol-specific phospholipase C1-like protein [Pseudohongiella spirulinae]|uniref:Putative secreted protein n=1 Tax=Pseudohongiella spirulinae TaxID=1249552 RepID=A0A0S2KAR9_9GAMM|nr:phosphatidylinositol-specific phospholipase C1-like protein [Pseudohongiella spirulinae]ALO45071.1 Putative secreted protein [Pseudohongiella spirulinae]
MRPPGIQAVSTLTPLLIFALLAWPKTHVSAQTGCADSNLPGDCLRLNQVQVLGSHNSYKRWPAEALIEELNAYRPDWARDITYEHRPLQEQLETLGLRQFELDVFADPLGGHYADPAGGLLVDDPTLETNRAIMSQPGFKVLHSQDLDYRTTCLTLQDCLSEIRNWSIANPSHLPIMIMLELKDAPRQNWGPITYTTPVSFTEQLVVDVDDDIWAVFDREHVITPDDVRGQSDSLEQAILNNGWPTLAQSRGKVLFAMDNTGRHRDLYLQQAPGLEGRAMFVSMNPGHPTAAFIKMNNAIDDHEQIRDNVARGYLVRTRSDVPSHEARTGDTTRRELALDSGAQYISTDYAEPSPFGSGYQVVLPDGPGHARCNPVSAPAGCQADWLSE